MYYTEVIKKDGTTQIWDTGKIVRAVNLAAARSGDVISSVGIQEIITYVTNNVPNITITVNEIHELVENALMKVGFYATAKEYIKYRASHKADIFKKRDTILPYEYPEVLDFVKAIRDSYWVHTHFTWDTDISDFNSPTTPQHYKIVYTRCALAIAQIEVAVKKFWGSIDEVLPKHEFSMLAATFDDSEARHFDTYRFVLELVGKNDEFSKLNNYPILAERSKSLKSAIAVASDSREDFLLKLVLFSTFIENVSLFSQFLIIASFDKYESLFPASTNGVSATNLDETTHFLTGIWIAEKIIEENPDIWTDSLKKEVVLRAEKSIETELALVDWIFDNQDLPFMTRDEAKASIKTRMKDSLDMLGISIYPDLEPVYFDWFSGRTTLLTNIDFFRKKGYNYDKGSRSYTAESIFGAGFDREAFNI